MHGNPITPECKKQRLHLTKRVLARAFWSVRPCDARHVNASRVNIAHASSRDHRQQTRHCNYIDRIDILCMCIMIVAYDFLHRHSPQRPRFRGLQCQVRRQKNGSKIFLGKLWNPGLRRPETIRNRTNRHLSIRCDASVRRPKDNFAITR